LVLVCGHKVAREQVAFRLGITDDLRPDQSSAIARDQSDRYMGIADLRVLGGDDDVAKEGQRGAKAGGVTVKAAYERLVEIELAEHDLLCLSRGFLEGLRLIDGGLH